MLKLEIAYASGTRHEVELTADVAVLGRDPHCDVVLNDTKCSRRHAVLESGPEGVKVRDAGSANGIYLNGRRVQSAPFGPGDVLLLGDVQVRLIAEVGETVVMAPDDLEVLPPLRSPESPAPLAPAPLAPAPLAAAAPSPAAPSPAAPAVVERKPPRRRPRPEARRAEPVAVAAHRPFTVTVLAVLWALAGPAVATAFLLVAQRLEAGPLGWAAAAAAAIAAAGVAAAMVFGLLTLAPWARHLQLATAAVALLFCPVTPAAATTLLYLTRHEVRGVFERRAPSSPHHGRGEPAFALTLLATLALGAAAVAGFAVFFGAGRSR